MQVYPGANSTAGAVLLEPEAYCSRCSMFHYILACRARRALRPGIVRSVLGLPSPDSKRKTYVLPLEKSVRLSERLRAGLSARIAVVVT
ncbi:MAG: hypothetical protein ABI862_01235 [Ilumatobacteraceae bacterium]